MPTPRRVGTRSARTSRGTSSARCPNCERLQRENAHLRRSTETQREEIEQLREQVLKAMRRSKRQAAPFSKGDPKKQPTRPGRKPGTQYGPKARRPIPDHVDEIHAVPLPSCCPDCGGAVISEQTLHQYQEEIPTITVTVRRFDIDIGHCVQCHKSVRGRHPLQTSDALGAAGVHVGPSALALGAQLNKKFGISFGKVTDIFRSVFSLTISRGGLSQALDRVADALMPTYDTLVEALQTAPVVAADETGWKVGYIRVSQRA